MERTASCNFTKYIKRGPNRWQHCPVVRGKTGRVKQDLVLIDGRVEQHPEGYYSLDWREGGRRHRRALGKDASAAQLALERHVATRRALAIGIAVAEDGCAISPGVEEACEEFLEETRVQRSPATFKQYRTALAYFQESCGSRRLAEVDRRTLLDFRQFLAEEKKLSPRTIWTKMMIVEQMLKTHGRNKLLRRGDWPRYVERIPQADTSSLHFRNLTFVTTFSLHVCNLDSNRPSPISFLFRKYLEVAGRRVSPEECLHSFHFDFGKWAIIVFGFVLPVLPDANLSLSCYGVLVPSL